MVLSLKFRLRFDLHIWLWIKVKFLIFMMLFKLFIIEYLIIINIKLI